MNRHATRIARAVAIGLLACVISTSAATVRAQSESARSADRTLQLATSASLLVTGTLGTLVAMNQPTLFSDGLCAKGRPIFGDYGCHGFGALHGLSALLSLVLYTATQTLEFAEFDWPGRDRHNAGFRGLSYVHLVGMALQPIGGLLAAVPGMVGAPRDGLFTRVLRSIHLVTGYAIVSSFVITTAIEL